MAALAGCPRADMPGSCKPGDAGGRALGCRHTILGRLFLRRGTHRDMGVDVQLD